MQQTLGILITSDGHWDDILQLTKAAKKQNREVFIYLTGKGVLLIREPLFESISNNALIYLCRESCKTMSLDKELKKLNAEQIVSPDKNIEIIEKSDRYLVF